MFNEAYLSEQSTKCKSSVGHHFTITNIVSEPHLGEDMQENINQVLTPERKCHYRKGLNNLD